MSLEDIFSTQKRLKILEAVVFQTERISVNQIAVRLKLSKGLVSKYLDRLVQERIAKRADGSFRDASKILEGAVAQVGRKKITKENED